ncbi:MAG: peptidylprolyl isomerase [Asticcacaulis sp.]
MSLGKINGGRATAMRVAVMAAAAAVMMSSVSAFALDPGFRAPDPENTLVIDTTKGQVIIELYPQMAPASAERMRTLAHQHFYDGLIFHRVMEDFMDQTGDPKGDGTGGSTLPNVKAEFTVRHDSSFPMVAAAHPAGVVNGFVGAMPVASQVNELMPISKDGKVQAWGLYCQGTVGLARDNDVDSGNSQFFLMRAVNSNLERNYTAVGTVLTGLDVVRKIKIGSPAVDPDKMLKVRVLSDIPVNERPNLEVMDTLSPQFKALIEATRKEKGADFSPCDMTVPVKVLK